MSNKNWLKIMEFQAKNRNKATEKETAHLRDTLAQEGIPIAGLLIFTRDSIVYPLFDAAAMCVSYWEAKGLNLNIFTEKVVKILSEGSNIEHPKKERTLAPPIRAEIELEWGGGIGLEKEED